MTNRFVSLSYEWFEYEEIITKEYCLTQMLNKITLFTAFQMFLIFII